MSAPPVAGPSALTAVSVVVSAASAKHRTPEPAEEHASSNSLVLCSSPRSWLLGRHLERVAFLPPNGSCRHLDWYSLPRAEDSSSGCSWRCDISREFSSRIISVLGDDDDDNNNNNLGGVVVVLENGQVHTESSPSVLSVGVRVHAATRRARSKTHLWIVDDVGECILVEPSTAHADDASCTSETLPTTRPTLVSLRAGDGDGDGGDETVVSARLFRALARAADADKNGACVDDGVLVLSQLGFVEMHTTAGGGMLVDVRAPPAAVASTLEGDALVIVDTFGGVCVLALGGDDGALTLHRLHLPETWSPLTTAVRSGDGTHLLVFPRRGGAGVVVLSDVARHISLSGALGTSLRVRELWRDGTICLTACVPRLGPALAFLDDGTTLALTYTAPCIETDFVPTIHADDALAMLESSHARECALTKEIARWDSALASYACALDACILARQRGNEDGIVRISQITYLIPETLAGVGPRVCVNVRLKEGSVGWHVLLRLSLGELAGECAPWQGASSDSTGTASVALPCPHHTAWPSSPLRLSVVVLPPQPPSPPSCDDFDDCSDDDGGGGGEPHLCMPVIPVAMDVPLTVLDVTWPDGLKEMTTKRPRLLDDAGMAVLSVRVGKTCTLSPKGGGDVSIPAVSLVHAPDGTLRMSGDATAALAVHNAVVRRMLVDKDDDSSLMPWRDADRRAALRSAAADLRAFVADAEARLDVAEKTSTPLGARAALGADLMKLAREVICSVRTKAVQ
ncbi:hypothetical protein NFJ02_12g11910 [Pycnococcus provasolii]